MDSHTGSNPVIYALMPDHTLRRCKTTWGERYGY